MTRHRLLVAALPAVLLGCAATPPPPATSAPTSAPAPAPVSPPALAAPDLASKVDPIFADFAKPGSPGCAVGVYRAGDPVFTRGYGLASLENAIPIDATTVFELGSVSKQFTALATLLLVEDGKVSLEDDVRKYVPELPVYGKPITLLHLLHHTSGLRDYTGLLNLAAHDDADVTNDADALFLLTHQKGLNFPPGTEWSYSNSGYFLLSIVVKRASGKTLAEFSRERIFEPLGMTSTFILDDHRRVMARRATGYAPLPAGGFGVDMSDWEQTGDGAVQSSVVDLAKWDANFYAPKVGKPETLARMRTPGALDDGTPVTYAMGLIEVTDHGIAYEEHAGAWAGYRSDVLRFPKEKVAVAVLCNVALADPSALADRTARALFPALDVADPPAPAAPAPYVLSAPELAAVEGLYFEPRTFEVRTLGAKDGKLYVRVGPQADAVERPLGPTGPRDFVVAGLPAAMATAYRFEPAKAGAPARLVRVPHEGRAQTFDRMPPFTPTEKDLAAYVGRYESEEIPHDLAVEVVGGKLIAGSWGRARDPDPLVPVVRDAFTSGGGRVFRFDRDANGKVRGVTLAAERMVGVRFVKKGR